MEKIALLAFAVLALAAVLASRAHADRPSISGGWFYVNGEKFFVKGIGHELGSRPGQLPWEREFRPDLLNYDLKLIKEGGFNTIRSWNNFTEQELQVIDKYGLMVIQGLWCDIDKYINEPGYAPYIEKTTRDIVRYSKNHGSILLYSINNEPESRIVAKNGLDKVNAVLRHMKGIVNEEDPGRAVAISHANWNEDLDQTIWDVVFYNSYIYGPVTNRVMGYGNQLAWLKKTYADPYGKPAIVGEFGLSVSKAGDKNQFGYGGNTLQSQKEGDIRMYDELISAGLEGGCLFMWNDGWWKGGDKNRHIDHPEGWFGILGIENEKSDPKGEPRPVYYAFKEYNRAIVTSPLKYRAYSGTVPVEVYATADAASVSWRLNGGAWQPLKKEGRFWFKGSFDCAGLPEGKQAFEIKAVSKSGKKALERKLVFWAFHQPATEPSLALTTNKEAYEPGERIALKAVLKGWDGKPVQGARIRYAYHNLMNGEEKEKSAISGSDGSVSDNFVIYGKAVHIKFSASADVERDGETVRYAGGKLVSVRPSEDADVSKFENRRGKEFYDFEYSGQQDADKDFKTVYTGDSEYKPLFESDNVKSGSSALRIEYTPRKGGGAWGYMENTFSSPMDISKYKAAGFWLYGDGSNNAFKLMLRDADKERWFDSELKLDWTGWKRVIFPLATLQRDPYDGVTTGNNAPGLKKVAGLAIVMTSTSLSPTNIIIDDIELFK